MSALFFTLACANPSAAPLEATSAEEKRPASPPPVTEPSASAPVLRFIAMGDGGVGNDTQYAVAKAVKSVCAERGCDFVLYLGDNIYNDGVSGVEDPQFQTKFEQPYAELDLIFHMVLGNHDYGELSLAESKAEFEVAYSEHSTKWSMPARHYTFTQEHVQFYALDTNQIMVWDRPEQQAWLDRERAASTADWHIAFGHHPYISNGQHGNAGEYEGSAYIPIASGKSMKDFMDTSICGQMNLYLSGHDHNRQWLEEQCGTNFIVSGAAAKTSGLVGRETPTHFEDDRKAGFLWVEIEGNTLTGVFYDQDASVDYESSFTRGT